MVAYCITTLKNRFMKKFKISLYLLSWILAGIAYFPIFVCAWLLHIIARILLGIAYILMLRWEIGKNVLSSIFITNLNL